MPTSSTSHEPWPERPELHALAATDHHRADEARSTRPPTRQRPPTRSAGEAPRRADDQPAQRHAVLRCLPEDARAIFRCLPSVATRREQPGSRTDAYLDHLMGKPWGVESRVYDDALVDMWMLQLHAGAQTSDHCHPAKDTVLLCLHGTGFVTTGDARRIPIARGSAIHIEQGAAHRSTASSDLTLVEVETPRDKFDLVRLEDLAGRRGRSYEGPGAVRRRLPPLVPLPEGPPRARLRPAAATAPFRFALEASAELNRNRRGLIFAISLDPLRLLRRELSVLGAEDVHAVDPAHPYLTIHSTHKEESP